MLSPGPRNLFHGLLSQPIQQLGGSFDQSRRVGLTQRIEPSILASLVFNFRWEDLKDSCPRATRTHHVRDRLSFFVWDGVAHHKQVRRFWRDGIKYLLPKAIDHFGTGPLQKGATCL